MSTMDRDIENHISNLRYDMKDKTDRIKDEYLNQNHNQNSNLNQQLKQSLSDQDFKWGDSRSPSFKINLQSVKTDDNDNN